MTIFAQKSKICKLMVPAQVLRILFFTVLLIGSIVVQQSISSTSHKTQPAPYPHIHTCKIQGAKVILMMADDKDTASLAHIAKNWCTSMAATLDCAYIARSPEWLADLGIQNYVLQSSCGTVSRGHNHGQAWK